MEDKDTKLITDQIHLESVQHLTEWKSTQLNIGILGATTGSKKHSFVNTLIGNDIIKEALDYEIITANEPIGHVHPENPNVIFWEMPECLDLDRNEFISLLKIERYDVLMVCQCEAKEFDENDVWLADRVKSEGKPVFFVKFNLGTVEREAGKDSIVEAVDRLEFQIIEKINNEFHEINSSAHQNFYTVSTCVEHRQKLEFTKLNLDLIQSLNRIKSETFTFVIEPFSPDLIHKKHELLKTKTFHSALVSTVCGIFTHILPGVGLVIDLAFLVHEIRFYLIQFGLNEDGLSKMAKNYGIAHEDLIGIINKSSYASLILLKDMSALTSVLVKILPIFAAASAVESIKFLPLVGSIIHGSMSFLMTKYALLKILDEFAKVALDVHDFVEEENNKIES